MAMALFAATLTRFPASRDTFKVGSKRVPDKQLQTRKLFRPHSSREIPRRRAGGDVSRSKTHGKVSGPVSSAAHHKTAKSYCLIGEWAAITDFRARTRCRDIEHIPPALEDRRRERSAEADPGR